MRQLSRDLFAEILSVQRISRRLVRELRFVPEEIADWSEREMLAIGTRSKAEGLLLVGLDGLYALPYELVVGLKDSNGRAKPIICDLCYTWQQGGKAGRITFRRKSDGHAFTYLCCGDLNCSLHVRDKTPESTLSRTQLREDITADQRIKRLRLKLADIIATLDAQPTGL